MSSVPEKPEFVPTEEGQSQYRQYSGPLAILTTFVAAGTTLFALLYVSGALPYFRVHFLIIEYNAMYMAGSLVLVFLLFPARQGARRDRMPWYDVLFMLGALASTTYVVVMAEDLETTGRYFAKPVETVLGLLYIVVLLEAVRRTVGWPMVVLGLLFLLYAKLSYLMPGILSAHLQTWPRIVAEVYLTASGMFGTTTSLASGIIIAFIAFGAFFVKVGGGQTFLNLALSLTGGIRGGPAKAAIVGSAMFGTLSGSPAANVAVTGTITIPMMKKTGYSATFAGAVETVASTGGMIMPPIMGATAFVMASFLGVSYVTVAIAATIPALLYFIALFIQTDLRAAKDGLQGISKSELPSLAATIRDGWEFGIPLLALVILLFVLRYPPAIASSYTIGSLIAVSLFRKSRRLSVRGFVDALADSAKSMLMVAPVISASGIIIATLGLTGLGPKLASSLVTLFGNNLQLLVLAVAISVYIMGMGVNITITYILLALLVAPALTKVGVPMIVAHFFIFYMGLTMFITPPYAPATFVAAAISGAPPYRTGFQAMRLGIVTFLVPFILIYNPALIMIGTPAEIALAAATAIVGVFALAVGIEGYLFTRADWWQRILALAAGLTLMMPGWLTDFIGIGLLAVVILWQWFSRKSQPLITSPI